ncbi:MAG: hypothetical protein J0I10_15440 [Verrucomicrobia bacterium]|nr:hypothetical protein [Verrucomicrobiota bacterium]
MAAFTLMELLAGMGIVAVLVAMTLSGLTQVRSAGDSAKCVASLRAVGQGIVFYVNDNTFSLPAYPYQPALGQLPGPLNSGQKPVSSRKYQGMLAYMIYPYLGLPEPTSQDRVVPMLQCPAWKRETKNPSGVSYYLPNDAVIDGRHVKPFGYPAPSYVEPMRMLGLPGSLSSIPVLQDIDRMVPGISGADWAADLPAKPVHRGRRNLLYLDGHVTSL